MIRSLLQPKQHIVSNTFINILFQSIRSDLLGVDEGFARNAIAQVSSSFLRKTIQRWTTSNQPPFLIDDPETLGRSFQTLFGPFWVETPGWKFASHSVVQRKRIQKSFWESESRFVLGAVKHNSAFSTVTRVNISMESKSPCKKGSFVSFIK